MQPNPHHSLTRTRSLEPRRTTPPNTTPTNTRYRKYSGQRNTVTSPPPASSRDSQQYYTPPPLRAAPRDAAISRVMSPPTQRGYPQSPLARTSAGQVFTFESRDHQDHYPTRPQEHYPPARPQEQYPTRNQEHYPARPRPREGLDLWSGTRSEPTTPKLLSPDHATTAPAVMVPQRDSPFLYQRSLFGNFRNMNTATSGPAGPTSNLKNISENLRSVTTVHQSPGGYHPAPKSRGPRSTSSTRLNPMAPVYQPEYRNNLTLSNSLPSTPVTSSSSHLMTSLSRPRSVSPAPPEHYHSVLRRNTFDILHPQEVPRVRSVTPNQPHFDTLDHDHHIQSYSDPTLTRGNASSTDPYRGRSASTSRITSPSPISAYSRNQKHSLESGYSSSGSSGSRNSGYHHHHGGGVARGPHHHGGGVVRRRTFNGADRCSTPVSSPPPPAVVPHSFVKSRESSEVIIISHLRSDLSIIKLKFEQIASRFFNNFKSYFSIFFSEMLKIFPTEQRRTPRITELHNPSHQLIILIHLL